MNITDDCVECIIGQITKATNLLQCSKSLSKEIHDEVLKRSKTFSTINAHDNISYLIYVIVNAL